MAGGVGQPGNSGGGPMDKNSARIRKVDRILSIGMNIARLATYFRYCLSHS